MTVDITNESAAARRMDVCEHGRLPACATIAPVKVY
jgi:hypothetical protein